MCVCAASEREIDNFVLTIEMFARAFNLLA